jgi:hypothetical protein
MNVDHFCACGKLLRLGPEHVGRVVACPACHHTFTVPENLEDLRSIRPRWNDGETYALAEEDEPPPAAVPVPQRKRPVLAEADATEEIEESQPRPEWRRRRRGRSGQHLAFRLLAVLANLLPLRWAYTTAGMLAVIGAMVVFFSFLELRLAAVSSSAPQKLTLAHLAAQGPGNNAWVIVTNFIPAENFVFVVRTHRFDPLRNDRNYARHRWEKIYVPLLPLTPRVREQQAQDPDFRPRARPGDIRVILSSGKIHSARDLDQLDRQTEIKGMVINEIQSLDSETRKLLEEEYPGTDFSRCYLLQEGRGPASALGMVLGILGGTLLTALGLLYALLLWLFATRGDTA